jgi:hypothetical protein
VSIPFTRSFRLIERLFPRSSPSSETFPSGVIEDVQPTYDVFANRPGEFFFRQFQNSVVGPGTINCDEPGAGRIQIPIMLVVGTTVVAANTRVFVVIGNTGNANDPWGRWSAPGAPVTFHDAIDIPAGNSTSQRLAIPPYVHRGSQLNITSNAGAGETTSALLYWIDAPGELVQMVSVAATFAVR